MLLVLDAVCRLRSTTKAAEEMRLSQPAISKSLKRLAEITGRELFIRTSTNLEPTQAGIELWEDSLEVLELCENLVKQDESNFDPKSARKTFTIAVPHMDTSFFLRSLVLDTCDLFPLINIHLINMPASDAYEALETKAADIYIGYKNDRLPKSIDYHKLLDVNFDIVCSNKSPLFNKGTVSRDDFVKTSSLMIYKQFHESVLDEELKRRDLMQEEFKFIPDVEALPHALNKTDCLYLATAKRAKNLSENYDTLKTLEPKFELPQVELYQMWHRSNTTGNAHKWLRTYIEEKINNELYQK